MTDTPSLPGLPADAAEAWMTKHVAGIVPPLHFTLIAGGHSNLTYGVTDAVGNEFVLRRGPLGRSGGGAHNMAREHRVIAALADTDVPVPLALAVCEDESVIGATFFVMSKVAGAVIDNEESADRFLADPLQRRHAGEQIVDVLADLHRVDIDSIGLGTSGRREDFLSRQLARFRSLWVQNATRELPLVIELADRLVDLAPPQRYTGIVHGDYRIGNVMLAASGNLAAVLDWELWSLGDVLADLGFLLNNWYEPNDAAPLVFMEMPPTVTGQFGSRSDVVHRYALRTGFDVSAVEYYRAFQHWRVAVLAEGVKRRYESAHMASSDVDFVHLNQRVVHLAQLAHQHLSLFAAG
jgi:aminoglycoside phosphotransferase (APT) family kinase protein